jgi:hypothetical protein
MHKRGSPGPTYLMSPVHGPRTRCLMSTVHAPPRQPNSSALRTAGRARPQCRTDASPTFVGGGCGLTVTAPEFLIFYIGTVRATHERVVILFLIIFLSISNNFKTWMIHINTCYIWIYHRYGVHGYSRDRFHSSFFFLVSNTHGTYASYHQCARVSQVPGVMH